MIDAWIEDFHAPNIFWLRGHTGVGKSAVAASAVQRLQTSRRLGSSFFFKRDTAVLTAPAALWRTAPFDLTRKYPDVRRTIVAKLNADEIGPSTARVISPPYSRATQRPARTFPLAGSQSLSSMR
jgi:adenylylsulfate kinase-like enzyme